MNVTYGNIKTVLKVKMNDFPHIILLNHGNAHWQLLISRNLLTEDQLKGQNLIPDFKSPWYETLNNMKMSELGLYYVLQNDTDGNCGPHILLQILQILQILPYKVNLTKAGSEVLSVYENAGMKDSYRGYRPSSTESILNAKKGGFRKKRVIGVTVSFGVS